jgi:hypothetical protein
MSKAEELGQTDCTLSLASNIPQGPIALDLRRVI